jgi:hypothetical protein
MNPAEFDKELGTLVRRGINSGLDPIIILGLLGHSQFEVSKHLDIAMHTRAMAQKIRNGLKSPRIVDRQEPPTIPPEGAN